MRIFNCTRHEVNIKNKDGSVLELEKDYEVSLPYSPRKVKRVYGADVVVRESGHYVRDLPAYKEGFYYIVSYLVAQALPFRKDLLITGDLDTYIDKNGKQKRCCLGLVAPNINHISQLK